MEAISAKHQVEDARWSCVRTWNGLRGESKLAWQYLWGLAGHRPGKVVVHPASIGLDQGAAQPDKCGRNCMTRLAEHALIQVLDRGPVWTLYVEDPAVIAKGRICRADPQVELFPNEGPAPEQPDIPSTHESTIKFVPVLTAHVGQDVPSPRSEVEVYTSARTERSEVKVLSARAQTSTLATAHPAQHVPSKRPDSAESQRSTEPQPAGDAIAEVLDRVKFARDQQPADARGIAERILLEVNDPNLMRSVCERIGWAIVQGSYPRTKLEAIMVRIKRDHMHRSAKDRGKYFLGAMARSFTECGLELYEKKPALAQPPPRSDEVPW